MTDRTVAALTDATDVLKTIEFFATHTDTPLTPTERLQAISLLIGDWKSDRAVLDRRHARRVNRGACVNGLRQVIADTIREHVFGGDSPADEAECCADAVLRALAEPAEVVAERDRLRGWFDELELAAGMGSLADVAAHQRSLGVEGDHETRLRAKRVAKLKATVMEEHEWRRQVLHEWQERAEQVEEDRDRLRAAVDAALELHHDNPRLGNADHRVCAICKADQPCPTRVALAPVADPDPHTTSDKEQQ
jgi:hypothetical protein